MRPTRHPERATQTIRLHAVRFLACVLVAGAGLLAAQPTADASGSALRQITGPISWGQFLGDAGHSGTARIDLPPPLEVAWRFDDPLSESGLSSPLVVGDAVIGVGRSRVYVLDTATGEVRTTLIRQPSRITEPAVAEVDGRPVLLFVQGTGERTSLVAVDLGVDNPVQLWTLPLGDDSLSGVTLAGEAGDIALVGDRKGDVHAVTLGEVSEGESRELWTERVGGNVDGAIAAAGEMAFVPVSDPDAGHTRLVALRLSDGKPRWTFDAVQLQSTLSSVAADGDQVVVGFQDRSVRSIDPGTGEERWAGFVRGILITTPTTVRSAPILVDGDVYVEDVVAGVSEFLPSAIYRFDGDTGERVWDFQFDASPARSAPLASGDVVYMGLDDGRVAAVDRASGDQVWIGDTGSSGILGLAPAGDLLVAGTGGASGGFIGLRHAEGQLVRVESPTRLDTGKMLADLGIGLVVACVGLFLLFGVGLRRFGPSGLRAGFPAGPDGRGEEPDTEPHEPGDEPGAGPDDLDEPVDEELEPDEADEDGSGPDGPRGGGR